VLISWSKGALLTPFLLAFPRSFVCEVIASLGSILSVTTRTIVTVAARAIVTLSARTLLPVSAGSIRGRAAITPLISRAVATLALGTLEAEGSVSLPIPALEVISLACEEFVGS
jgi:hypothetical protein